MDPITIGAGVVAAGALAQAYIGEKSMKAEKKRLKHAISTRPS